MGRRPKDFTAPTRLAAALIARRGPSDVKQAAPEIGISFSSLARIERGGLPALETADRIARWLGWTLDDVHLAAKDSFK